MPRIPEKMDLKANSAQILNTVRNNATPYFRSATADVDPDDISTLRAYGTTLLNNDGLMNEFLNQLLVRIGLVWTTSKLYQNPWAFLKKGMLELGEVIEEIFVTMSTAHLFDPQKAETTVFQREIPNVETAFHKVNSRIFYKQTIQNDSLRSAFLTWGGVEQLIADIVNQMYSALAYDEFLITKYMIALAITNGDMWVENMSTPTTPDQYRSAVASMKAISNLATFMSSNYNAAGVPNFVNKDDQYIIINSMFDANMAVEVLATSYNMDKASLMGRVVLVDDFGTFDMGRLSQIINGLGFPELTADQITSLKNIPAVLIDKDWFMIFDQMIKFTEIYNSEGLYWNYTLHAWKVYSYSPFANAIAFSPYVGAVTGVTVTPATVSLKAGDNQLFKANVTGGDFAPRAVSWTTNSDTVRISPTGNVYIPGGFTGSVTVTATSKATPSVKGTATITVS